ncbi:hypothetical protein BBP40_004177 [Aspergillus hancockii]|nr:hypothetical protein BBP40_004177 [Aspergillus hancockii]
MQPEVDEKEVATATANHQQRTVAPHRTMLSRQLETDSSPRFIVFGLLREKPVEKLIGHATSAGRTAGLDKGLAPAQLLPQVGFAWTVRCLGFAVIFCIAVCLTLARTRPPKRPSEPLIEPNAFRERPYLLFVVGIFPSHWAVYFSYFYTDACALNVIDTSKPESFSMLYIVNGIGIPGRITPTLLADCFFRILTTYVVLGAIAGILLN